MAVLWIFLVCAFWIPPHADSFPFLYNPSAITTFISSASAASATPDTNSNIQDFTKQAHEPKKLQTDQQDLAPGSSDGNEVVPSIIQKKISKILRKIQFITQLGGSGGGNSAGGGEMGGDFDDFFKDEGEVEEGGEAEQEQEQGTEANQQENDKKAEVEEFIVSSTTTSTEKPSKYSVSPSSIAVFFMEVVGTVMGLFYGAAAQLGNGQNGRAN